ncbi:class II aldolase and Adducin N-terminal domain-containing protein [Xylogone sp. PMI_703]|nr:class II aldolase and Adducin N-terminal domain-containing protein [Xylogone sp. PMI_703]
MSLDKDPSLSELYRTLISSCHILHYHRILDAYGHISVRHPRDPKIFIMCKNTAPATVSSRNDLIEYWVENAEPVDPNSAVGYAERCIHSEILKRYPEVNSVIHSHSDAVVPYTISGVPLKPCYHMGGFLRSSGTPIYDNAKHIRPGVDNPDMLVRNTHLGAALAATFSGDPSTGPDHSVVLMRGHGMTIVGPTIQDCVLRAIYTQNNASIQTTALLTRAAWRAESPQEQGSDQAIHYLSQEEADAAMEMTKWSAMRPWTLWLREVEAAGLYVNRG